MADSSDELDLDTMFGWLEEMPVPEGYKAEIVEGNIFMSPQRTTHWRTILRLVNELQSRYTEDQLLSDVRIDFPGHLNGFCCDLAAMCDGSDMDERGRWRYQDVELVAEVISRNTAANDYGPKLAAYAEAGVPVYLVVDPYQARCFVYTEPKGKEYTTRRTVDFGDTINLEDTVVRLTLTTDRFRRD